MAAAAEEEEEEEENKREREKKQVRVKKGPQSVFVRVCVCGLCCSDGFFPFAVECFFFCAAKDTHKSTGGGKPKKKKKNRYSTTHTHAYTCIHACRKESNPDKKNKEGKKKATAFQKLGGNMPAQTTFS